MQTRFWSQEQGDELASAVFETVRTIENDLSRDFLKWSRNAWLYTDGSHGSSAMSSLLHSRFGNAYGGDLRMTLNVVASCIDTVTAKVAKGKPRVEFLSTGGDEDMQRRAQNMTRYVDAVFFDTKLYVESQKAFVDACIFGTGAIKAYVDKNKVRLERVPSVDLLVDVNDGIYGAPRELHQRTLVQRAVLKKMYPKKGIEIDRIDQAPGAKDSDDTVVVIESWRRPSTDGGDDGRHAISVDGCTLFDEPWKHDWFPFAFLRWKRPLVGFYGMGLAEELKRLQLEVNKLARTFQLAMHMLAVPKIFVEAGSQVNEAQLNNDVAGIIEYVGTPPVVSAPTTTIAPDSFAWLQWLYSKAYELSGVSQLNASSMKPAGLNSGAALRAYQDNASERFALVGQQYDQLFVDIAEIVIALSKENFSGKTKLKGLEQQGTSRTMLHELRWEDIDLDRDALLLRPYTANPLGDTPAGRLQMVTELVQAGVFDPATSLSLLDFPDVQATIELETAPLHAVKAQLDRMLDTLDYEPPDEFMDLKTCVRVAQLTYNKQLAQAKPDDDKLELLRTYLREAMALAQQAAPAPAPAQNDNAQMGAAANMAPAQLAG